jgi:hypothetical protein
MTWTRPAKCKDCIFLKDYKFKGHKRHICNNTLSEKYNQMQTLKDLVCDKWKMI